MRYLTTIACGSFLICMLSLANPVARSQDKPKSETIEATAMGTETQTGKEFPLTLIIYEFSPASDKQVLAQAFQNGKDQGLVDALSKMKAVGHIAITGTLGADVSYIEETRSPNGRRIRFITNRLLSLGEVNRDSRSVSYNLTAGEIDQNLEDKSKNAGVLYPAAQLVINKQGDLQMNLIGSPWKLVNILDR